MAYFEFIEDDNHPAFKPKTDNADDGHRCKCCGRLVKRYRRTLNSNMALTLIHLYKSGKRDWLHVEKFLQESGHPRSGDFHKLVLWGLLDKMVQDREDGSPRNGYYKLNGKAIMFVENKLTVPKIAKILNGTFEGFEGKEVTIKDCLNEKFNYETLMGS